MNPRIVAMRAQRYLFGIGSLAAASASAAPSPALDRTSLWLGAYLIERQAGLHGAYDGAGSGGLESRNAYETIGRVRLDVLVGDDQGFTLDYYGLDHHASSTLSRPFEFEGVAFDASASLHSALDFGATSASYDFWFGQGDDVFGVGVGAVLYRVGFRLEGTASVAGVTAAVSARIDESAVAPLLQLAWKHAFSDSTRIYVHASGVARGGGTLSGHVYDARAGLEWFPTRHFGVAAEYGVTRIHVRRDTNRYDASFDVDLDGPSLFARLRF